MVPTFQMALVSITRGVWQKNKKRKSVMGKIRNESESLTNCYC